MALFSRQPPTRAELLAQAAAALAKGRKKKALRLHERVLELEPDNLELHGRIAPLLAETGRREEAWASYQRAAEHHREEGFVDKAISVYRQAAEKLPRNVTVWERLAELLQAREQPGEAYRVLEEGTGHFKWRRWRTRLRLLHAMHRLQPENFACAGHLARLLVRDGRRSEALELLAGLEAGLDRRGLARVRGLAARLSPTPGTGWRWLTAVLVGR
jgi:tetratricopeptide (TPR) repeat protein